MSPEPLPDRLRELKLRGMAAALERQISDSESAQYPFDIRLHSLIQSELDDRAAYRTAQRLRWSRLPEKPRLIDIDTQADRGLTPETLSRITKLDWIDQHLNLLITGPAGVGKSFLACALAHAACNAEYTVRFFRIPKLMDELAHFVNQRKSTAFFRQLSKIDLLILDDFGLTPLNEQTRHDLLEILDARYTKRSTLVTSQFPIDRWRAYLAEPTIADAILDRLIHNAHRVELHGESMRKQRSHLNGEDPSLVTEAQTALPILLHSVK